jgi:anti-sigma regulatory factor (Ser/Thr protein kinase)
MRVNDPPRHCRERIDEHVSGRRPESAALRLRIPPDPRLGRAVREQVAGFTQACAAPEADASAFITAVFEAFANAVEHADSSEPIELTCSLIGGTQLRATIVDHGIGFPLGRATQPVALPEEFAERGRGLLIMRRCSDRFSVRSTPGRGTTIILGRTLEPRPTNQGAWAS